MCGDDGLWCADALTRANPLYRRHGHLDDASSDAPPLPSPGASSRIALSLTRSSPRLSPPVPLSP